MQYSLDVLKMRILTCFIKMEKPSCNVTGLARSLNSEKYAVSRAMKALEQEGLLNRNDNRHPSLTDAGFEIAKHYTEKIDIAANHLLDEGVNTVAAKEDAFLIAMYCSDETFAVIKAIEDRMRIKKALASQDKIDGDKLCKKLRNGVYEVQFIMYRKTMKNNSNISMANGGFYHPCTLTVKNGEGIISLKAKTVLQKSPITGKEMQGKVSGLKYFDGNQFIEAERQGDIVTFPINAMSFIAMGENRDKIIHGSLPVKMVCSAGLIHMPESMAIFTLLI